MAVYDEQENKMTPRNLLDGDITPRVNVKPGAPIAPEEEQGDFSRGLSAGWEETKALGAGLVGMAGSGLKEVTGGAVGEGMEKWGQEGYREGMKEAGKFAPPEQAAKIEEIDSVGEFADWAQYNLGKLVPMVGTSLLGGGVGGVVARTTASTALKGAAQIAAQKTARSAVDKAALQMMGKRMTRGSIAGAAASSVGLETGSIYGEILEETGEARPWEALGYGTIAGLLDVLPEARLLTKMGMGEAAQEGIKQLSKMEIFQKVGKELMLQAGLEAGTEAAQTVVERAAVQDVLERGLTSPEALKDMFNPSSLLNAAAVGALGGGVMGGGMTAGKTAIEQTQVRARARAKEGADPDARYTEAGEYIGAATSEDGLTSEQKTPGFYSALTEAAKGLKQKKGSAEQFVNMLKKTPGVKQEEMEWLGVEEWAEGRGKITQEELVDFIEQGGIQLEERKLGGRKLGIRQLQDERPPLEIEEQDDGSYVVLQGTDQVSEPFDFPEDAEDFIDSYVQDEYTAYGDLTAEDVTEQDARLYMQNRLEAGGITQEQFDEFKDDPFSLYSQEEIFDDEREENTKFADYQMGGESKNYGELLLKLPSRSRADVKPSEIVLAKHKVEWDEQTAEVERLREERYDYILAGNMDAEHMLELQAEARRAEDKRDALHARMINETIKEQGITTARDFTSPHFDDDANVLGHVRFNERTVDGKRTLFLEELQSDWHQKGRKQGYEGQEPKISWKALEEKGYTIERRKAAEDIIGTAYADAEGYSYYPKYAGGGHITGKPAGSIADAQTDAVTEIRSNAPRGVPDAPFKKSWPALMMKRMIRYAAENGYDQVAWTPGSVQNERYDLSQKVSEIIYTEKGELEAFGLQGQTLLKRVVPEDKVKDYIGKEAAKKLLAATPNANNKAKRIEGEDLKLGGEGMKGFYDKILPAAANKIIKKMGAKVGVSAVGSREEGSSVTTGEMRALGYEHHPFQIESDLDTEAGGVDVIYSGLPGQEETVTQFETREDAYDFIEEQMEKLFPRNIESWSFPVTPEMKQQVMGKGQAIVSEAQQQTQTQVARNPVAQAAVTEVTQKLEKFFGKRELKRMQDADFISVVTPKEFEDTVGHDPNKVQAVFLKGKMIIHTNVDNPNAIILHEGTHSNVTGEARTAGLHLLLGNSYTGLQKQFDRLVKAGDPLAVEAARRARNTIKGYIKRGDFTDEAILQDLQIQERLAYYVEEAAAQQTPLFKRFSAKIRAWFRQSDFGKQLAKLGVKPTLDDAMIIELARMAINKTAAVKELQQKLETETTTTAEQRTGTAAITLPGEEAQTSTIKASASVNMGRMASLLGPQLYGEMSQMAPVTIKELFQNSFDAIKGAIELGERTEGKIDIQTDQYTRTITIKDDGTGMSPDTIQNAFLKIAGTEKPSERSSGGFGIAKMLFLFGNESLSLVTVKKGVKSELSATGKDLMRSFDDETVSTDIEVSDTTEADGTTVVVTVPESYTDPSTGLEQKIAFPADYYGADQDLTGSPLFENVDVSFNGSSLKIGKAFPVNDYIPFATVNFKWGDARIVIRKEEAHEYSGNVTVLSNGLRQFDQTVKENPFDTQSEIIPRKIYINVEPKVKPTDPGYPFALNRKGFSPIVASDFQKILRYISVLYGGSKTADVSSGFGTIEYALPGGKVTEEQTLAPESKEEAREGMLNIDAGSTMKVVDGKVFIEGRQMPELTADDIDAVKSDLTKFKIPQEEVDASLPMIHDNTLVVEVQGQAKVDETKKKEAQLERLEEAAYSAYRATEYGSTNQDELRNVWQKIEADLEIARAETHEAEAFVDHNQTTKTPIIQASREKFGAKKVNTFLKGLGDVFMEIRDDVIRIHKDIDGYDYNRLAEVPVGVSFDQSYRGVHVWVPFQGMFVNPGSTQFRDFEMAGIGIHTTMLHEIAHERSKNHTADFVSSLQELIVRTESDPEYKHLKKKAKLSTLFQRYEEIFNYYQEAYENGNVENVGRKFEDSDYETADAGTDTDVVGTGSRGSDNGTRVSRKADRIVKDLRRSRDTRTDGGDTKKERPLTSRVQEQTPEFKLHFRDSKVTLNERAGGTPRHLYHGTMTDVILQFNTEGMGAHFGTQASANERLATNAAIRQATSNTGWSYRYWIQNLPENSNIIPVTLRIEQPLRMVDVGAWHDAYKVADALSDMQEFKNDPELIELLDEVSRTEFQYHGSEFPDEFDAEQYPTDMTPWRVSPENAEYLEELKRFVKRQGHDGIIYKNDSEDFGSTSYIAFDPEQIKSTMGNSGEFSGEEILTSEVQENTPEFKDWFEDSIVVDEQGRPAPAYRGMTRPYKYSGDRQWYSSEAAYATMYAGGGEMGSNTQRSYLRIERPIDFGFRTSDVSTDVSELKDRMEQKILAGYKDNGVSRADARRAMDMVQDIPEEGEYLAAWDHFNLNADVFVRAAELAGFDGFVSREGSAGVETYLPFAPNQIKSAIGNRGTFDRTGNALTSRGDFFSDDNLLEEPVKSTNKDKFLYWVQDKLRYLYNKQAEIVKDLGVEELPWQDDPYLAETRYHGMTRDEIQKFHDNVRDPMLKLISVSKKKIDGVGGIDEFLLARHAQEANQRLRRINAKRFLRGAKDYMLPDQLKRVNQAIADLKEDGGGPLFISAAYYDLLLEELPHMAPEPRTIWERFSAKPSGMTDERANEVLEGHRDDLTLQQIGDQFDQMNRRALQTKIDAGLLTQEEGQLLLDAYEHWAPLKRVGYEDKTGGQGQGFSLNGREFIVRAGSGRDVSDLLANAVLGAEIAITRSEKQKVGEALYNLVKNNPDPNFWKIDKEDPSPVIDPEGSIRMYPKVRERDNEVRLKIRGKMHKIEFEPTNINAYRIAHGLKNFDNSSGAVVQGLSYINRMLSWVNTSASPEFFLTNPIRDVMTAQFNLSGTKADKMRTKILKDFGPSFLGIRKALRTGDETPMSRWYEDFAAHGGTTGWIENYKSVAQLTTKLERQMKRLKTGSPLNVFNNITDFIGDYNTAAENAIRLSTYKNLVESAIRDRPEIATDVQALEGVKARAAQIAKELTVNFNRKGAAGQTINAFYLFANAGIQGSMRILHAMKHSKKGKALALGTVTGAFGFALANRELGGDDDEGNNNYDKIPDWIKERNMIFMRPDGSGNYNKIPLPWGYNVLWVVGDKMAAAAAAGVGDNPQFKGIDAAASVITSVMGAFSPIQGGTFMQAIAPTVADPFMQAAENKTFTGAKLKPEANDWQKVPAPEHQQYWANARPASVAVAKAFSDLTGGDKIEGGWADFSPEYLDLMLDTVTGSAGRFVADTINLGAQGVQGKLPDTQRLPFWRRFYGEQNNSVDNQLYRERIQEVWTAEKKRKELRGDPQYKQIREEINDVLKLTGLVKATEKQLRKLRKLRKMAKSEERKEALSLRMDKLRAKFNSKYRDKVLRGG